MISSMHYLLWYGVFFLLQNGKNCRNGIKLKKIMVVVKYGQNHKMLYLRKISKYTIRKLVEKWSITYP